MLKIIPMTFWESDSEPESWFKAGQHYDLTSAFLKDPTHVHPESMAFLSQLSILCLRLHYHLFLLSYQLRAQGTNFVETGKNQRGFC